MTNTTELDRRPLERLVMPLSFGSSFAGIGGFDLGFERAGMVCKWQVEIDDYANRVLAQHWPDVRRWPDVRTWPQPDTERVDVICGGFPCTDISQAGGKAGLDGEQSGLWADMLRTIRELRPRFAVVENSTEITHRGLDRVLGQLAEIGFDAEWSEFSPCVIGAPHTRKRVFVVAYSHGDGCLRARLPHERRTSVFGIAGGNRSQRGAALSKSEHWETQSRVPRVVDGIPCRVDRIRAIGNAVVPQVAEWIGRRIIEAVESAA